MKGLWDWLAVKPTRAFRLLAVAIGALLLAFVVNFRGHPFADDVGSWGAFGDFLGGLTNPLVAMLALVMLILSVQIQRHELAEMRNALADQGRIARAQAFDQTFFQLLQRFDSVRDSVRYRSGTGRVALASMAMNVSDRLSGPDYGETFEGAARAYQHVYRENVNELGPYFRTLYHVFKKIDLELNDSDSQVRYANIARAGLSNDDLRLIFLNCLVGEGKEGFKPLVEKYGLLKHLDVSTVFRGAESATGHGFAASAFQAADQR